MKRVEIVRVAIGFMQFTYMIPLETKLSVIAANSFVTPGLIVWCFVPAACVGLAVNTSLLYTRKAPQSTRRRVVVYSGIMGCTANLFLAMLLVLPTVHLDFVLPWVIILVRTFTATAFGIGSSHQSILFKVCPRREIASFFTMYLVSMFAGGCIGPAITHLTAVQYNHQVIEEEISMLAAPTIVIGVLTSLVCLAESVTVPMSLEQLQNEAQADDEKQRREKTTETGRVDVDVLEEQPTCLAEWKRRLIVVLAIVNSMLAQAATVSADVVLPYAAPSLLSQMNADWNADTRMQIFVAVLHGILVFCVAIAANLQDWFGPGLDKSIGLSVCGLSFAASGLLFNVGEGSFHIVLGAVLLSVVPILMDGIGFGYAMWAAEKHSWYCWELQLLYQLLIRLIAKPLFAIVAWCLLTSYGFSAWAGVQLTASVFIFLIFLLLRFSLLAKRPVDQALQGHLEQAPELESVTLSGQDELRKESAEIKIQD